jgi:hypothetical protein
MLLPYAWRSNGPVGLIYVYDDIQHIELHTSRLLGAEGSAKGLNARGSDVANVCLRNRLDVRLVPSAPATTSVQGSALLDYYILRTSPAVACDDTCSQLS